MKLKINLRKSFSRVRRNRVDLHKIMILCGLSFIVSGIMGCYNAGTAATTLKQDGNLIFQRVAVAPFQQTTPEQMDINAVDCSRCWFVSKIDAPSDRPEAIVEQIFIERLKAGYKVDIIPPDRVAGIYERYVRAFDKVSPRSLLKKVGDDLDADVIAFGYIYRFRERQGTPYAAAKSASVAFEIHLFRVSDGALVWKGHFEKTQTSLMENVLQASVFLKGGGRWVTARELSEEGMDNVMKNFPAPSK